MDRFARRLHTFSWDRSEPRTYYDVTLEGAIQLLGWKVFANKLAIQQSSLHKNLDFSTWTLTIAPLMIKKPELAYRQLRHAEQVFLMAQILIHNQMAMPTQFNAFVTKPVDKVATIHAATQISLGILQLAEHRAPVKDSFEFAKNLLISNFNRTRIQRFRRYDLIPRSSSFQNRRELAPSQLLARARESFLQPDQADLDQVQRAVQLRIQNHVGILALKRQQLARLLCFYRKEMDTFFEAGLLTGHAFLDFSSIRFDHHTFCVFLERAADAITNGQVRSLNNHWTGIAHPYIFSQRMYQQIDQMDVWANQWLQQWQKSRPGEPPPDSLQKMLRIANSLRHLMKELNIVLLQWFHMEIPDTKVSDRFLSQEPDAGRFYPRGIRRDT